MEIESLDALDDHLADGGSLHGLRLQNLDLSDYAVPLAAHGAHGDLAGLVVLGGVVPTDVAEILHHGGAVIFPQAVGAPVDPWRGLYHPEDLYAGLENGYPTTPDARAYAWSIDGRMRTDAYATLIRAIHDDSVTDELDEFVEGRSAVGVMGGHALLRGTLEYAQAAELGRRLAAAGHVVLTGGGPGAMEAANLGAFVPDGDALADALARLATVPSFRPDITPWAQVAMEVRHDLLGDEPVLPPDTLGPSATFPRDPDVVLRTRAAERLLRRRGEVLLQRHPRGRHPGAQQCRGRRTERCGGDGAGDLPGGDAALLRARRQPAPPLVLVGRRHWTETVPVWPALLRLATGRRMAESLHLVDTLEEALDSPFAARPG